MQQALSGRLCTCQPTLQCSVGVLVLLAQVLKELWCAPQVMFLKYQLPSEPSVYVDLLDDEDVSLMFDEVRFLPLQRCRNPWNLSGSPPAHMALPEGPDSLAAPRLIAQVWAEA